MEITFWDRLSELLSVHRLTQADLSKKFNLSPSYISMAMGRGTLPRGDFLIAVAQYFKVSPVWLMTGEDEEGIDVKYAVVVKNKRIMEIGYNLIQCDEVDVAMVERFAINAAKIRSKDHW